MAYSKVQVKLNTGMEIFIRDNLWMDWNMVLVHIIMQMGMFIKENSSMIKKMIKNVNSHLLNQILSIEELSKMGNIMVKAN